MRNLRNFVTIVCNFDLNHASHIKPLPLSQSLKRSLLLGEIVQDCINY